jgi:hypothetical protein
MVYSILSKTVFYFQFAVNSRFSVPSQESVAQPQAQGGHTIRQRRLLWLFLQ